jgi:hypothetical protein
VDPGALSHPVNKSLGLRSDQEILVASTRLKNLYPKRLRKISYRDETQGRTLVFVTNNFTLPADKIAALYKARWEIELFFKWIKQNLRVKTFYGTSANSVKTQIWIAMIVYLVLAILKQRYKLETSLSKLLHFLEVNLFEQKSLISIFQPNARITHKKRVSNFYYSTYRLYLRSQCDTQISNTMAFFTYGNYTLQHRLVFNSLIIKGY